MGCFPSNKKEEITSRVNNMIEEAEDIKNIKDFKIKEGMLVKETKADPLSLYEVVSLLGEGAFGKVDKVRHKISKEVRAMKMIEKDKMKLGSEEESQLINEINIVKSLDHPNIMKVFEYFNNDNCLYIVSELLSGGELFEKLQDATYFKEDVSAYLMKQIFSAVDFCHQNHIIHRDLKPENILIESEEEARKEFFTVKIIDFGTCGKLKKGEKCDVAVGTPLYTAPEVVDGKYNEKCDLWSCGVIMYMLLSGKQPFTGEQDNEIYEQTKNMKIDFNEEEWDEVSNEAKNLIKHLLTKDVDKRYSARQALEDEWITKYKSIVKLDKSKLDEVIKNIRLYSAKYKIQQSTLAYIVHNLVHKEDTEDLRGVFIALDENGDGRLTKDELLNGFNLLLTPEESEKEVNRLMDIIDVDGNGFIEYEEFLRAGLNKAKILTPNNLQTAFMLYDINNRGKINALELRDVLGQFEANVDQQVWQGIIDEADVDKDGEINFSDFQKTMEQC